MKKIHMVDVVSMYKSHASIIDKKIKKVINSGSYIRGVEVEGFEDKLSQFLKSKFTISCGNGTDALYIALMALDLKKGDEVLVPSFTFVSTVEAICLLGLVPVFIDIDPDTFLLNHSLIPDSITTKTKAIIPVHLFGQCCDMLAIRNYAKKYKLYIVEDAAQSIGSKCVVNKNKKTKSSGTIGDIGITSFYPSKNLGAFGDGGAIFTQNKKLANKIKLIANHGQNKKYNHQIIGLNSRLDAIQAAILSFKLTLLNEHNNKRQNFAKEYDSRLLDLDWVKTPVLREGSNHIYHQYSIILDSRIIRKKFQAYLASKNIPTMIYYPIPLHKQKAYRIYHTKPLPISEKISQQIISLPIHPAMNIQQIKFICDVIKKFK